MAIGLFDTGGVLSNIGINSNFEYDLCDELYYFDSDARAQRHRRRAHAVIKKLCQK